MERQVYEKLCSIVHEKSGIALNESKEALLSARLGKRIRELGLQDFKDYLGLLLEDETGEEVIRLLDAISTNVTSFFRESEHFEFIRGPFMKWVESGQTRFRFWSAASSTGEEPYTLGMTLLDVLGGRQVDLKILATDISTRALEKGKAGIYEEKTVEPVPVHLRDRYMERSRVGKGEAKYSVREVLKGLVSFRRINLASMPFPMRGPFDVIMCRNVMIYFDDKLRRELMAEMYRLLRPDGYLLVGHAESLSALSSPFKPIRPSIYFKAR